jgi:hypothetical protein
MKNLKLITTLVLAFAFLFAQVGNVAAAPLAQETTPITGTIDTIVVDTDANGDPIVVVTLLDGQSYSFSVETAASLNLLVLDPVTGEPVLDPATGLPQADLTQEDQPIEFLPTDVLPDETEEEESVHPISALLAAFFNEDASVIDGYHTDDGFGFGVIAQALWMSKNLTDDASLAGDILDAKQDKDFETFFTNHPEYLENFGDSMPTNWGQFKKGLLEKKNNLGNVVSGHAEDDENSSTQSVHEKNKDKGHGNGNGNGHGNGHGNNRP